MFSILHGIFLIAYPKAMMVLNFKFALVLAIVNIGLRTNNEEIERYVTAFITTYVNGKLLVGWCLYKPRYTLKT